MPLLYDDHARTLYRLHSFATEAEFEKQVIALADQIFGPSSIYVDVKRRIRRDGIVTIPDGYVIDMADPAVPRLYVVENEIVSHDPFEHVGIQLMKFVVGFHGAQYAIRTFLMAEIAKNPAHLQRLEAGCRASGTRNIDAYLDRAVYAKFHGLVVIDEAQAELHHVIQQINAQIDVIELHAYRSDTGSFIYEFDTLYDEDEESLSLEDSSTIASALAAPSLDHDAIASRRAALLARRAASDTVIVPARKEGFEREFLGNHQWFAIRLSPAMIDRLKFIAAYQVSPVSAVTHIAEIKDILPYQDTGKYIVTFKGPSRPIGPIGSQSAKIHIQGPIYAQSERLLHASSLEDVVSLPGQS